MEGRVRWIKRIDYRMDLGVKYTTYSRQKFNQSNLEFLGEAKGTPRFVTLSSTCKDGRCPQYVPGLSLHKCSWLGRYYVDYLGTLSIQSFLVGRAYWKPT